MALILKFYLTFALILIFIDSSKTQPFCESFAKNGYRISYGFRRITKSDPFKSYIFINQTYWRLIYTDNEDNDNKTVHLMTEEGKQSNWFGNQFSMSFCIWFNHSCEVGLLSLDKKTITWGELEDSDNELNLKEISKIVSIKFESEYYQKMVTAFVPSAGHMTYKLVVFYQQLPENRYEVFKIHDDMRAEGSNLFVKDVSFVKLAFDPMSLNHLITGLEVIGVIAQYSALDFQLTEKQFGYHKGFGLIVLFKFDRLIKYCYTNTKIISKTCTTTPKLLIDCSKTVTETTVLPTESENNNLFEILIVVLVVIAFIAIVITVWYFRTNKLKEIDQNSEVSRKSTESVPQLSAIRSSESDL